MSALGPSITRRSVDATFEPPSRCGALSVSASPPAHVPTLQHPPRASVSVRDADLASLTRVSIQSQPLARHRRQEPGPAPLAPPVHHGRLPEGRRPRTRLRGARPVAARAPRRARYGKGGRQDVDAIIKERDDARAQLSVAQQALKTANDRLGAVESGDGDRARLQQELDRAVDQLHDAQRDADDARRQAREAEELFAAAADERAAKVKELVQEIDHWHDAAETAQRMEAEARSELEEARNRVRDLESRSGRWRANGIRPGSSRRR